MTFNTLKDANRQKLIQSTLWLNDTEEDRKYLETSRAQVLRNPERKTMFVQADDFRIALFVDNLTNEKKSKPRTRQLSRSKRFKSIRHLAEFLFSKKPGISFMQFMHEMKREYPKSEIASPMKCYNHFCVYRHHLVIHGRFRCIPRPKWFQVKAEG